MSNLLRAVIFSSDDPAIETAIEDFSRVFSPRVVRTENTRQAYAAEIVAQLAQWYRNRRVERDKMRGVRL